MIPKKQNSVFVLLIFAAILLAGGCGRNVKTHGKVVYSDDGSPVPRGVIILQNETHLARGPIAEDGSFTISSVKRGDGMPPGEYRISFSGINLEKTVGEIQDADPEKAGLASAAPTIVVERLVDAKYMNQKTSGLVYDTNDGPVLNVELDRYVP